MEHELDLDGKHMSGLCYLRDCAERGTGKIVFSHATLSEAGSFAYACPRHVGLVAELLAERNREALAKIAAELMPTPPTVG
jgi:hypothetical protein